MKITVDRYLSNADATLSRVTVFDDNGARVFRCYGCEDEYRAVKVKGETRIPAGVYKIGLRTTGGFHARYSVDRRVRDIHEGMLHILDVPGFEYILIHIGNYERDTDGCLLVGQRADERRMCVFNSAMAYRALYLNVIGSAKRDELFIEFQDNDR